MRKLDAFLHLVIKVFFGRFSPEERVQVHHPAENLQAEIALEKTLVFDHVGEAGVGTEIHVEVGHALCGGRRSERRGWIMMKRRRRNKKDEEGEKKINEEEKEKKE